MSFPDCMRGLPPDPYIRGAGGRAIGVYSSEPLPGGLGRIRLGQKFVVECGGKRLDGEVVGFESHGTNPYARVITKYLFS